MGRLKYEAHSTFRSRKDTEVTVKMVIIHNTGMAIRVSPDGREGREAIWLPISQIKWTDGDQAGTVEITIPGWLAKEKGLENDDDD